MHFPANVTEAHRQVPIHPDDWHFLGCQVKPGGDVFVNTVGTFGVASASYYWSRVAGSVGRLLQYLSGHSSTSWHMLVADDYLLESGGSGYRIGLLLFFVLCAVVGVPLSWHKTCGGDTLVWVGFEILLRSHSVGISSRRAEWFIKWAEKVAFSATIHMASFEEGLGRIMFVAGALEHERPFLVPLYKFLTMHPRNAVRRVLRMCLLYSDILQTRYLKRGTTNAVLGLRHRIVHQGSTRKLAKNVPE